MKLKVYEIRQWIRENKVKASVIALIILLGLGGGALHALEGNNKAKLLEQEEKLVIEEQEAYIDILGKVDVIDIVTEEIDMEVGIEIAEEDTEVTTEEGEAEGKNGSGSSSNSSSSSNPGNTSTNVSSGNTSSGNTSSSNTSSGNTSSSNTSSGNTSSGTNSSTNDSNSGTSVTHTCTWVGSTVITKEAYSYTENVTEWVNGAYFPADGTWIALSEGEAVIGAHAKYLLVECGLSDQYVTQKKEITTGTTTINVPAETKMVYTCSGCGKDK